MGGPRGLGAKKTSTRPVRSIRTGSSKTLSGGNGSNTACSCQMFFASWWCTLYNTYYTTLYNPYYTSYDTRYSVLPTRSIKDLRTLGSKVLSRA